MKKLNEKIAALVLTGLLANQTANAQTANAPSEIAQRQIAPGVFIYGQPEVRSDLMPEREKKMRALTASGIARLKFYPRVSGSTSTAPIGQLLAARALNLRGELRRPAPAAQTSYAGFGSFEFQDLSSAVSEPPRDVPGVATSRGRTKISGDLLYDDDSFLFSSPYFNNYNQQPTTPALQMSFPLDTPVARLQEYSNLAIHNTHRETHGSYTALADGIVDLILVAREPSEDEKKLAEKNQIAFELKPVALDALVFIANAKNALNQLSIEQIRGIYSGRIQNWKEVGGEDKEIYAITRDRNSGSQELLAKLVMQNQTVIAGKDREARSMSGTFDMAERSEDSLAYSVFYYERIMNPRATLKPLAVGGVLPASQTIANRTYPLVEPVYVVTRKNIAPGSPTAILRDWLLSKEGQKLIAQSGYVPIRKVK